MLLGDTVGKTPQSRFLTGSGRNQQSRNNTAVLRAHIFTSSSACSEFNYPYVLIYSRQHCQIRPFRAVGESTASSRARPLWTVRGMHRADCRCLQANFAAKALSSLGFEMTSAGAGMHRWPEPQHIPMGRGHVTCM